MYFSNFPKIAYDSIGDGEVKVVTNLLKRVAVRAKTIATSAVYDTYDVKNGETPEMIADKMYGSTEYHWVILLLNNITDRYHQWPMDNRQFLAHLNDKYSDVNALHHYEIYQTSGDTTKKINIGTDKTGYSDEDILTITNREYEQDLQDVIRKIKVLDPSYLEQVETEFKTMINKSVW